MRVSEFVMTNKGTELRPRAIKKPVNRLWRLALSGFGWLAVLLGVLGIFLPVLPTTPFLLLAAACFIRSSERFYTWLIRHPKLSQYIVGYIDGSGIPRKAKRYTLLLLWSSIGVSVYLVPIFWVQISLPVIAICVSVYIWRQPEPLLHQSERP